MKILVITQYFFPENFRVNDLVEGLVARGHQVTVLTGQPNYPKGTFFEGYGWKGPREETLCGARVIRTRLLPRGKGGGLALVANYFSFVLLACFGVLFRLKKADGFEAVFVFEPSPITVGLPAALARKRFRIPVLFWVLDLWPESLVAVGAVRSKRILSAVDVLVRWIYARSDRILVPSRAFVPQILRHGVPGEKIAFFPNWGEPVFEDVKPMEAPPDAAWPDGFRVLFAGNIGAAQDFPAVVEAATHLKDRGDIHWVIVGDGRMRAWAKDEVARRGLQTVHFLGQRPLEEMPALFQKADALLLSLKADPVFSLTIPGKLQSYLASGKPILAMVEGEAARLVGESRAGLACPAGDSAGLAAAEKHLVGQSAAERARMGEDGRRYFEKHFARDVVLDSLDAMLAEAVRTCKMNRHE